MRRWLAPIFAIAAACATRGGSPPAPRPAPPLPDAVAAVDEAALDRSVAPCDDFYAYACGGWEKATSIPDDEAVFTRSFQVIEEKNEVALRAILERFAAGDGDGAYAGALGDFYASCMDEAAIVREGASGIAAEMARIDAAADPVALARAVAVLHAESIDAFFVFGAQADARDPSRVVGRIVPARSGLPERDHYSERSPIRAEYERVIAAMLEEAGEAPSSAAEDAATVTAAEAALTRAQKTTAEMRDPRTLHHRMTGRELAGIAPTFRWDAYFDELGAPRDLAFDVMQPEHMRALDSVLRDTSYAGLRAYLRWQLLHATARALAPRFARHELRLSRALLGIVDAPPRWKACVRAVHAAMGDALAAAYVKEARVAAARIPVRAMVTRMEAAMRSRLLRIDWLDDSTRARALEKLARIKNEVGFPDSWRRYDGLAVARGSYVRNRLAAAAFERKRRLAVRGDVPARPEWQSSAASVDAYYEPTRNEIVLPAGLFQPPLFDEHRTAAANFGALGMIIGHELTHAFDDEGRRFDETGALRDWWTPDVASAFERRAACIERQFDKFVAVDEKHVTGRLTLGEDLADLGGLVSAHAAFEAEAKAPTAGARFSAEQEFFLAFAQSWCAKLRPEAMRLRVETNPHAPPRFRVNGTVANMPQFARAFSCAPGTKMVRGAGERCDVW